MTSLIRYEYFGPVVWSSKKKKYFLLARPDMAKSLEAAVAAIKKDSFVKTDYPDGFGEELVGLGVSPDVREIHSPYADRLSGPFEVYFDYTWSCNLAREKCGLRSNCYAAPYLGHGTMPKEQVRSIMEQLNDWGMKRVHLAGGEPTIYRDHLDNYLGAAHEQGIETSMASNGTIMTEAVAKTILSHEIYSVSFSMDGYDEPSFAAVRGAGLFDNALRGVKTFLKARNEASSRTKVFLKMTYRPDTPSEGLENIIRLALDTGVDSVKLNNPEKCLFHEQGYYKKVREDYYRMAFIACRLRDKYADKIGVLTINNPLTGGCSEIGVPGAKGCIGGQELIAINPDGQVTPCLMHRLELGNIKEFASLRDLWARSSQLASYLDMSKKVSARCTGCNLYAGCRGGSHVRKIVQNEPLDKKRKTGFFENTYDPLCPKDYILAHPEIPIAFGTDRAELKHFKALKVAHSL